MNSGTIKAEAIDALDRIYWALWEIDIPSPTCPEYIEHHNDIQSVMRKVKNEIDRFVNYDSTEPKSPGNGSMRDDRTENTQIKTTIDTISRAAAIKAFDEADLTPDGGIDANDAIKSLRQLPAAERQRMRGRWNTYYHGGTDFSYSCARCGYGAPFDMRGGKVFQKKWNYCPNCGADMKGADDDR